MPTWVPEKAVHVLSVQRLSWKAALVVVGFMSSLKVTRTLSAWFWVVEPSPGTAGGISFGGVWSTTTVMLVTGDWTLPDASVARDWMV